MASSTTMEHKLKVKLFSVSIYLAGPKKRMFLSVKAQWHEPFMGVMEEVIKARLEKKARDFPGGPVVKTLPSSARGVGSIPGWGS